METQEVQAVQPNPSEGDSSNQRKPTNTATFDRINLSPSFVTLLTEVSPNSKIIEQLVADMDLNKFKEFLGLVKKTVTETDEELAKRNLTSVEVDRLVQALISELVNGSTSDIKCIIHNFIKASAKKDAKFVQRVSGRAHPDTKQLHIFSDKRSTVLDV